MTRPDHSIREVDQRRLQGSEYVDDDGSADPALLSALAAPATEPDAVPLRLAALAKARLVVPVVAVLGEVEYDDRGLARDKSSDMAAVLLTGRDGRTALLAFTSTDSLAAWNPEGRPVPVAAHLAAATAVQEGAAALLVDVAGPHPWALEGDDLTRIAAGWQPVRLDDGSWAWLGASEDLGNAAEDSSEWEETR